MTPRSSQDLPGFWDAIREARRSQQSRRRGAYVRDRLLLCGEPVRPLTLRDVDALEAAESPLVCGGVCGLGDALQLVWLLSPEWIAGTGYRAQYRRQRLAERVGRWSECDSDRVAEAVRDWVADQFAEFGGGGGGSTRWPVAGLAVSLVAQVQLAGYPLPDETILDLPLVVLAGKLAVAAARHDPDWCGNDAALTVRRRYMDAFRQLEQEAPHG